MPIPAFARDSVLRPVYDVRPVPAMLEECRRLRRQAAQMPFCAELARLRTEHVRLNLAAIRANRHALRHLGD